jgi:hypothetical protein
MRSGCWEVHSTERRRCDGIIDWNVGCTVDTDEGWFAGMDT